MSYLIDTHTLIWYINLDKKLSPLAEKTISNQPNIFIGIDSLWEIAVKMSLGKLQIIGDFNLFFEDIKNMAISILDISQADLNHSILFPFHHRDPFDRMIISQAQVRNLSLISADTQFDAYELQCIW